MPWKIHHFDGIYQERWGFSWAMLVYQRVYKIHSGVRNHFSEFVMNDPPLKNWKKKAKGLSSCSALRGIFFSPQKGTFTEVIMLPTRQNAHF